MALLSSSAEEGGRKGARICHFKIGIFKKLKIGHHNREIIAVSENKHVTVMYLAKLLLQTFFLTKIRIFL